MEIKLIYETIKLSKYAKKGDAKSAYAALYKRKVMKGFLETEIAHSGD